MRQLRELLRLRLHAGLSMRQIKDSLRISLGAIQKVTTKNHKKALKIVENTVREMTADSSIWKAFDEEPESAHSHGIRLALWKFTKSSQGLPSISKNGTEWINNLKDNLKKLFTTIGVINIPKMGLKIRRTGLDANQMTLPLFEPQTLFPPIRQETIHQVKGESIDGVLVLGSTKYFNTVVKAIESNENSEERRLAYVAMTRARHVLLIGLPATHFDKHVEIWKKWGFNII